jgi:hypothetical protein
MTRSCPYTQGLQSVRNWLSRWSHAVSRSQSLTLRVRLTLWTHDAARAARPAGRAGSLPSFAEKGVGKFAGNQMDQCVTQLESSCRHRPERRLILKAGSSKTVREALRDRQLTLTELVHAIGEYRTIARIVAVTRRQIDLSCHTRKESQSVKNSMRGGVATSLS